MQRYMVLALAQPHLYFVGCDRGSDPSVLAAVTKM